MVGIPEIIVLAIIGLNLAVSVWSFMYVFRKAAAIKKLNPYELAVWQIVIIQIFVIFFVDSIGAFFLPILLKPLIHPLSCLIMPIYLKRKYKIAMEKADSRVAKKGMEKP